VTPGPLTGAAELIDLGPTSLAALGVPSAVPRDGKVLPALAGEGVRLEVTREGSPTTGPADGGLTSDEEGEIEEHLRGLGYVE
jgi:hypothetical protein